MKSSLKKLIFLVIFTAFKLFAKKNNSNKRILIVKLDAIGDYILFRNTLKYIKESPIYKDYSITFVGNENVKVLAEWLDSDFIDRFIWLDKKKVMKRPLYLFSTLYSIGKGYDVAVQPTYSRELLADRIIKSSEATQRITFLGDTNNITLKEKEMSDLWYTKLIHTNIQSVFDFNKNKVLVESLIGKEIELALPIIEKDKITIKEKPPISLPMQFAVIFPGASSLIRRWPASYYATIARYINKKYKLDVVICGSSEDSSIAKDIKKNNSKILDLTGRTDLKQLVYTLSKTSLLITNDTSAAHIGPALSIPVIALSQYNFFGRFLPYPAGDKLICITPNIYSDNSFDEKVDKFKNGSDLPISLIKTKQVEIAIDCIMESFK